MHTINKPHGEVHIYKLCKDGKKELLHQSNQIQDDYTKVLVNLIATGKGKIDTMYLEYSNNSNYTIPQFDTDAGAEYYAGLSGNVDFIRHNIVLHPDITDTKATFSVIVGNDRGFHNLPFGGEATSHIYGAALVVSDANDQTKDLIFSRTYWDNEKIKTTEDLLITWTINFNK